MARRRLCLGPAGVIICTPLSALSFWVSSFPWTCGYNTETNEHRGKWSWRPREDEGRDQDGASTCQETPKIPRNPLEAGGDAHPGRDSTSQPSEETNSADTLILGFQPPELCKNMNLLFQPPVCITWLHQSEQTNLLLLFSGSIMPDFFATPWTVAYQAPLSMGFSRQECWSGLPFPPPGEICPLQGSNLDLLHWRQILYL